MLDGPALSFGHAPKGLPEGWGVATWGGRAPFRRYSTWVFQSRVSNHFAWVRSSQPSRLR